MDDLTHSNHIGHRELIELCWITSECVKAPIIIWTIGDILASMVNSW